VAEDHAQDVPYPFDNAEGTLTFSRFQTSNFDGWSDYPDILEPLLFYVLQRASSEIEKATNAAIFKVFLADEASIFLKNATIRDWVVRAERTWRKKNAAMILATQSVVELADAGVLNIINESCPTKIFLANPNIDRKLYAEIQRAQDTSMPRMVSNCFSDRSSLSSLPSPQPRSTTRFAPVSRMTASTVCRRWSCKGGVRSVAGDSAEGISSASSLGASSANKRLKASRVRLRWRFK
jgi:hypothetical protein